MTYPSICHLFLFKPQFLMAAVLTLGLTTSFCTLSSAAAQSTGPSTPNMEARADSRVDPRAAIVVGPRELVGKPSLGEKAAASVVGGLVGSVLGGSSRKSPQPRTRRDPSRKQDYNNLAARKFQKASRRLLNRRKAPTSPPHRPLRLIPCGGMMRLVEFHRLMQKSYSWKKMTRNGLEKSY